MVEPVREEGAARQRLEPAEEYAMVEQKLVQRQVVQMTEVKSRDAETAQWHAVIEKAVRIFYTLLGLCIHTK